MRILRILFVIAAFLFLLVVGAYCYFIYTPSSAIPPLPGSYQKEAIQIDGISRYYSFYIPASLIEGAPLIFVLHGSKGGGDLVRMQTAYELDLLAEKKGYIAVYPDGFKKHWNDCRRSADYAANKQDIDDLAFFSTMIRSFVKTHNIDVNKVFVTGISNGGHMAYRLALELPEQITAIAPIAANLPVDESLDCIKAENPLSIAIFNGSDDPINPYEGGVVNLFGNTSRGEVLSTMDTIAYWLNLANITQEPLRYEHPEVDGNTSTSVIEQRWLGDNGIQVRLYTLQGSGHVIPSKLVRFPRILGRKAGDISAAEEIVNFFLGVEWSVFPLSAADVS